MTLEIISAQSQKKYIITHIELATTHGSFVIQDGHAPTVFILEDKQPAIFTDEHHKEHHVMVTNGIAHVTRNSVTIFVQKNI